MHHNYLNLILTNKPYLFYLVLCCFFFNNALSQEQKPDTLKKEYQVKNLSDFGKQSQWTFRSRSFFMSTINEGNLKDDYTLAQGAGLGLITAPVKGFQMGFSGYYIFNVWASDLASPDLSSAAPNRYEIGQYDITNINNKQLARFEDLFLKYTYKKNSITIGRMDMNTPFINAQDGRMRPTYVEGVLLNLKKSERFSFDASYVWRMSPRSTFQYYLLKDATGLYGQGLNPDGSKSNYKGLIESKGFFTAHISYHPVPHFQIQVWNGYFENVMNTALLELKNEIKTTQETQFYQALMFIHQDAVNYGGSNIQSNAYINKGSQSNTISVQCGYKSKKIHSNLNYTHITGDGRYLMPREWGRDPFYTFMPRERNEGSGNVHAMSLAINYMALQQKLKLGVAYGYFMLPELSNVRLNKYGMPAYHQLNATVSYQFHNFWKGMELRFLTVSKLQDGNETLAPKYVYNKVNMLQFNVILDIRI